MAFSVGLPAPRRGLRSLAIVLVFLAGPYFFLQHLSTLDLDTHSGGKYAPLKRHWEDVFGETTTDDGPAPKTVGQWPNGRPEDGFVMQGKEHQTALDSSSSGRHRKKVQPKKTAGSHQYLPNGLVTVNPAGRHPVYDLVERAQSAWEEKNSKASKTLSQAIDEYRRRYHRAPPKGFDRWWAYAQKHNVQLPDEYDQIHKDLEPFHAYTPAHLHKLVKRVSQLSGMYTLACTGAPAEIGGKGECTAKIVHEGMDEGAQRIASERAEAQLSLLEDIQNYLEPVDAVFYSHDVPWQFVGHGYKGALEDAASVGEYHNHDEHEIDTAHLGWSSACAPHKPLREDYDLESPPSLNDVWAGEKSFIWDHKASMDPCSNPTLTHTVGFLSGHGKGPGPSSDVYPVMAMCKTTLHSDVLAVSMEAWTEDVGDDPSWEEKMNEKMLWRGKTTGIYFKDGVPWNISQRANLVTQTARTSGDLHVLPVVDTATPIGLAQVKSLGELNEELVDVAFVDEPIQCDQEICDDMKKIYHFDERVDWAHGNQYKYLLDIDGNGWSARFKRLMSTNSLILKSTIFPEWYTDRVQPWVHYVPIKADLTDLYDVLTFFRGGHDDMAKEIAMAGKDWSKAFWRKEDMVAYQFRLFLELARVMSDDRDAASYHAR